MKRRRLHDKKKRTMIVADDKLEPVFGGKKQGTMLETTMIVYKSPHLFKIIKRSESKHVRNPLLTLGLIPFNRALVTALSLLRSGMAVQ